MPSVSASSIKSRFAGRITTLIVDDNPGFLDAMARFLESGERTRLIGCAESGEEAIEIAARLKPQLVVMDVKMPGMGGLQATRELKSGPDPPRIIILTLQDDEGTRAAAQSAQADGFLSKQEIFSTLSPMIDRIFPWCGQCSKGEKNSISAD